MLTDELALVTRALANPVTSKEMQQIVVDVRKDGSMTTLRLPCQVGELRAEIK
jgi:hypothetical protein